MQAPPTSTVAVLLLNLLGPTTSITSKHPLSTVSSSSTASIRIGTRSSRLALTQARKFQSALHDKAKDSQTILSEIVHIDAAGDQTGKSAAQRLPLALSGVDFTGALDEAVLNGSVDVAVHSLKDIPPTCRWNAVCEENNFNRITIGAYLGPRATPLDVLITRDSSIDSIQALPHGAKVGSASIRRQAQLKANRSDLSVINIRGNVDARLKALENGEIDALILAMAGLKRLGIIDDGNIINRESGSVSPHHYHPIPVETILPGCGQGVIAITCRSDNPEIISLVKEVDDHKARIAATTERAFLDTVQRLSPWDGRPPTAGFMRPSETSSTWLFDGLLATPDGARVLRVQDSVDANTCNEEMAQILGQKAGEEVAEMAGDGFLNGYF